MVTSPAAVLVMYCVLILVASLAGGWVPLLLRLTHRRMELLISLVSGVMLGVALLHLLPHAWLQRAAWLAGQGRPEVSHDLIGPVVLWMLAGFLVMFFVERFFCFHHHDVPDSNEGRYVGHGHELTWTGAAVGLTMHSLVAGVALAASMPLGDGGVTTGAAGAAGLGTFLAIFLHKPFDSMTLGTVMVAGRRSRTARHVVNGVFALVVPIGAALFVVTAGGATQDHPRLVSCALAFSAGTFLCISLSDLLPELQFHRHDRVKLSLALLLGLAIAWGSQRLEAAMEPLAIAHGMESVS